MFETDLLSQRKEIQGIIISIIIMGSDVIISFSRNYREIQ